jgi:geranylgeranyl reductase family protein
VTPSTAILFDCTIVGTGPAGSLLAYELARHGRRVLLLEKRTLPRYKPCGGGLTQRARALLPFDIDGQVEDRARTTRLRVHYRTAFEQSEETAAVHLVMRDRFDHFLVQQAQAAGAVVRDRTRFLSLSGSPGRLTVRTTRGCFRTGLVIGADGVHSRVGRALGLPLTYRIMPALEAELEVTRDIRRRFCGAVHFDFGVIRGGYGWLFPKRNNLSAGILARGRPARDLKPHLMRYLARNGLSANRVGLRSLRLHPIPCRPDRRNGYADARGLVVGDATGLVDPVTGEGIFYALKSAQIAAAVLKRPMAYGPAAAFHYTQALKAEIEADVLKADVLARILYGWPMLSNWVLARSGATIGATHLAVYRGEVSYRRLFQYVMSPRGFAHLLRPQRGTSGRG